ncbi:lipase family protein [Thalassolituus alkanivorans]|uniref:lipase family protein n=1 Tax=Thalassolituus alkanivorans TaxID=2881055 RepID=UPI001E644889|nr:lipase family protein [Thalassolituus alkanivorans]MCB2387170.1 lipase family protein [Thalassolituus alkanivorans]MCB2422687.1 lipase family protein [Thalassolituus alkanivorans]
MLRKLLTATLLYCFLPAVQAAPDFAQLRIQAQLSGDTYLADSERESQLKQQGQTLIHQVTLADSQVSYFLSQGNGVQTIAIRGTANLANVMVDLDIEFQPDERLGITLHNGFRSAAEAVFNDVRPRLVAGMPVQITGHSLGGAIAVVLAMYLKHDTAMQITQVITFGQPKATNVTGADLYASIPLIRVVTQKDLVPLVPPLSPLQIKDLDVYWHMGEEIILLGGQQYSQTRGLKSMLRATKLSTALPDESNLQAHQIATYQTLIGELLQSAQEVPYQMEINLFGLSIN